MLWHYAYGKPTDIVDVTVGAREENLRELSTEELLERVDTVREQLREADATERALPAASRTASRPPCDASHRHAARSWPKTKVGRLYGS